MAKDKRIYYCQQCGASSAKWIGKCPSCQAWNTYVEEIVAPKSGNVVPAWVDTAGAESGASRVTLIQEIDSVHEVRYPCPDPELNRVIGGGIVPGSLVLLGGEPGIGKSTLLLQLALTVPMRVLYVSGEESSNQLRMRADRLEASNETCYILPSTDLAELFRQFKNLKPELVIVDSIQTLFTKSIESTPGSISQIRECTGQLLRFAKESNTPVFIIGHITKDGQIAGPKVLEHMVDTVLQFEGDRHHAYRILRTVKNRFGSAAELGIYEMSGDGLRPVLNPSEVLISNNNEGLSGVSITAALEGARPMLIETQALVSSAVYGTPQRNSNGYNLRRLNMLLAVLEKRCGFRLSGHDVFVNVAGGLRLDDPGVDLGIASAILSSMENIAVSRNVVFAGEIGLSGEIRTVNRIEQRMAEAAKLGFEEMLVSESSLKKIKDPPIKVIGLSSVIGLSEYLFG
ncbi:MAG: DNA repair protein RadA [Flavobacteriales bacterium]|nr:DNA repair protein RadA [Flavobacteriales bacterium]